MWGAVGAAAAATSIYLGVSVARQVTYRARLPTLPELSGQPAAVRAHLAEADRAARAQPTSADRVSALGLAYHADMFYEEAARSYAIAEALKGDEWRWTYYRALVHDARGETEPLAAALRRVVAAAPEFAPAWWRLGDAEFKARRYARAEEAWRRVEQLPEPVAPRAGTPTRIASAPLAAHAALGLARLAVVQGNTDRAQQILVRVTAATPRFGPAFRLLGGVYAALERPADAERALRLADALPAYDPYIDPMLDALVRESRSATFLLQQAATADVSLNGVWREHLLRRALEVDPDNPDALYELASLLRVLRRYDEALPLLERQRRLVPGDFQVLADLGRCLSGLQRFEEAETHLRRALDGLDNASTRYDLGFVLDRLGRLPEALVEYQRALERNPNHVDSLNNLGVLLARQGRLDEAARQLERLVAVNPDSADAHANLGIVLLAQGATDRAARAFRAALERDPDHQRARDGLREIERR